MKHLKKPCRQSYDSVVHKFHFTTLNWGFYIRYWIILVWLSSLHKMRYFISVFKLLLIACLRWRPKKKITVILNNRQQSVHYHASNSLKCLVQVLQKSLFKHSNERNCLLFTVPSRGLSVLGCVPFMSCLEEDLNTPSQDLRIFWVTMRNVLFS